MAPLSLKVLAVAAFAGLSPLVSAIGQKKIIAFESSDGAFQIAGKNLGAGQIRVSEDEYWGVIRAAGDLATDFGRVTGTNYTLSNGKADASPAEYRFKPVDVSDNTVYKVLAEESFTGPTYSDPDAAKTVVIAGTIGKSSLISTLIDDGKIDVSDIEGEWEAFVSVLVDEPIEGVERALVIAGADPRGTIFGIYDVSEQIGVSPWYFWADVPTKKHQDIYVLEGKVQGSPSVKYRGFFLNDEQPGLSNWVGNNFPDAWNGAAGYTHEFYTLVCELLLRLRANYFWPTLWGSIYYTDDNKNQPLADAFEVVLGSSHTEPLMRGQNEFRTYYEGPWAYNLNNETIDDYFRVGALRAKPYARNSLFTMAMRGTGDTEIEGGLGLGALLEMLEELVDNQRKIIEDTLEVDIATVPQAWCLYKEVQSYQEKGLHVPEDITLLWSDDNWGNVRRLPLANETERIGGAGVYYHFDYVGDPRDYKWINTIQLQKTSEQLHLAKSRGADRIWIVNVGDLKPLEIPITHYLDLAYDTDKWHIDSASEWLEAWATREFGAEVAKDIANIMTRYGLYAARRKYELLEPHVYSVINYYEAESVLAQWADLRRDAQSVYDKLDAEYQPAYFQMILHPIRGGEIVHQINIAAARNALYAGQKRNSANDMISYGVDLLLADANLTQEWDELLDGKWAHMMDQTHINYEGYWQQPMRNTLPAMSYVQTTVNSIAGHVGIGVEGSNATVPGDDKWHGNSANDLTLPPLEPYGPSSRYFDVFWRGTDTCEWTASPEVSWLKLSQNTGTVGPDGGEDTRVLVSVDWDSVPADFTSKTLYINVTTPCRHFEKYAYQEPRVLVPVNKRASPPEGFEGFVESDGVVSIEGEHYQSIVPGSSDSEEITYHTFKNYGRTSSGVGLVPYGIEKLELGEGPALEYNLYLYTNTTANVTLYLSPSHNYLGEFDPLEYAVALYPKGTEAPEPKLVRPVSKTEGTQMPDGWGHSVADAVWGLRSNITTSSFQIEKEGEHVLRIWTLLPSIIVQKIVINLGGLRPSYLGPPESFLVGRDTLGERNGTSFRDAPNVVGGINSAIVAEEEGAAVRMTGASWIVAVVTAAAWLVL
ncbi:hypothetical protein jhhlp_005228 [Lomentospora prolificans]|uniref:Gylcosyl hydrolase 115 C-terminal domain-containing protein n=1 Tax=Lomentospora prolificans TaxID=41688 RepID=A0A2N3N7A4_9PEZI|nr:hypothetical protein jhhlp_005228 [Lomentospora prolificans]